MQAPHTQTPRRHLLIKHASSSAQLPPRIINACRHTNYYTPRMKVLSELVRNFGGVWRAKYHVIRDVHATILRVAGGDWICTIIN
jgi:hypothetical protein